MSGKHAFVRSRGASVYLETFFVSAVAAVLGIRFYLHLTGYPQMGGDVLHIAHMLWGGLLMLSAIVMLVSYLDSPATQIAVVLGGLGFGTFIDEVGKFITKDNNYFFRPAVAIMYGIFILTYLIARAIHSRRDYTREENLVNAIDGLKEIALHDLDEEEKRQALFYLEESDPQNPLVAPLQDVLSRADLVSTARPAVITRVRRGFLRTYNRIVHFPGFPKALIAFFIAQLLFRLAYVFALIFLVGLGREEVWGDRLLGHITERVATLNAIDLIEIVSSVLSAVFVFWGVVRMRRSRLAAYRMFQRSVLVTIFLTQVFVFYREQFSALIGLGFNIMLLILLDYMMTRERIALATGGRVGNASQLV